MQESGVAKHTNLYAIMNELEQSDYARKYYALSYLIEEKYSDAVSECDGLIHRDGAKNYNKTHCFHAKYLPRDGIPYNYYVFLGTQAEKVENDLAIDMINHCSGVNVTSIGELQDSQNISDTAL